MSVCKANILILFLLLILTIRFEANGSSHTKLGIGVILMSDSFEIINILKSRKIVDGDDDVAAFKQLIQRYVVNEWAVTFNEFSGNEMPVLLLRCFHGKGSKRRLVCFIPLGGKMLKSGEGQFFFEEFDKFFDSIAESKAIEVDPTKYIFSD